jgi:hypothetical protein
MAEARPGVGPDEAFAVVRRLMADPDAQWSAGTFGAIAEFMRDGTEQADVRLSDVRLCVTTARGAIALDAHPQLRLVAYETVSRDASSWRHAMALCLPASRSALRRRSVVTELGADEAAVRPMDCGNVLFDLGLSLPQTDACIRTADAALIAAMRRSEGKGLFANGNPVLMDILHANPHRVFVSPLGRVEVYQPIPPAHGKSPPGPHTHILPKLLRANRTHAATTPIPDGWVPCATVYPAHPLLDAEGSPRAFDAARFDAFNGLYERFGDVALVALQQAAMRAVVKGTAPDAFTVPADKFARAAVRVGLRKLKASGASLPTSNLNAWSARFDRVSDEDGEEESQHAC